MADAPKEEGGGTDNLTQLLYTLGGLYLFMEIVTKILENVEESTGIDLLDPVGSFQRVRTLGPDTPMGTDVAATEGVNVFATAGGQPIGFHQEGSEGSLRGGPQVVEGDRWWDVDFTQGVDGWVTEEGLDTDNFVSALDTLFLVVVLLSLAVSAAFFVGLLYASQRIGQIRAAQRKKFEAIVPKVVEPVRNERWEQVLGHVASQNPNDWRQAIMEADIILDEMVTRMGYQGSGLGDKLKQIDRSDFLTLDQAWEAHKIRNKIAHTGSDFILTQREALRVIDLYRQVFSEFYYI